VRQLGLKLFKNMNKSCFLNFRKNMAKRFMKHSLTKNYLIYIENYLKNKVSLYVWSISLTGFEGEPLVLGDDFMVQVFFVFKLDIREYY
jgi:sulfatase maturation enzyme AslB (radical SAM superfamily)